MRDAQEKGGSLIQGPSRSPPPRTIARPRAPDAARPRPRHDSRSLRRAGSGPKGAKGERSRLARAAGGPTLPIPGTRASERASEGGITSPIPRAHARQGSLRDGRVPRSPSTTRARLVSSLRSLAPIDGRRRASPLASAGLSPPFSGPATRFRGDPFPRISKSATRFGGEAFPFTEISEKPDSRKPNIWAWVFGASIKISWLPARGQRAVRTLGRARARDRQ